MQPQRRPLIRALAFDEVGAAIGRLVDVASSDTGQAARVADFLLAWWNGDDNGHFPILHLSNCDAIISEDMLALFWQKSVGRSVEAASTVRAVVRR